MCDRIQNAFETLGKVIVSADNKDTAILNINEGITAEVLLLENAPYWTVFTYAKYAIVQALDEAQARDRGQRKLNHLFPGKPNRVIGVCAGRLLRVESPPTDPVSESENPNDAIDKVLNAAV